MRSRRVVAAIAGVAGAVLAHGLDVAGQLPFVHETAAVRQAMSPAATVAWLALAATLSAVAARRPATAGAVAALAIGGLPELAGRLDAGAMFEPAAVAGALLQWLLLVLVLTVAFAVHARLTAASHPRRFTLAFSSPQPMRSRWLVSRLGTRSCRTRAPPSVRALMDSSH